VWAEVSAVLAPMGLRLSGLAEPAHDPPEGEVIEIAERPRGHAVTEVVAPSPQHRFEPVEQVGERFDASLGG